MATEPLCGLYQQMSQVMVSTEKKLRHGYRPTGIGATTNSTPASRHLTVRQPHIALSQSFNFSVDFPIMKVNENAALISDKIVLVPYR